MTEGTGTFETPNGAPLRNHGDPDEHAYDANVLRRFRAERRLCPREPPVPPTHHDRLKVLEALETNDGCRPFSGHLQALRHTQPHAALLADKGGHETTAVQETAHDLRSFICNASSNSLTKALEKKREREQILAEIAKDREEWASDNW